MTTDPKDEAGQSRADRRAALRAVAPGMRRVGLLTVIGAAALILWARYGDPPAADRLEAVGLGLLIAGWSILAVVIARRTLHHRKMIRGSSQR